MTPRTWLVTGGTGLLGVNATRILGPQVDCVSVSRNPTSFDSRIPYPVDIRDARAVRRALEAVRPSVVLHAAALASHELCEKEPQLAWEINVEASAVVAREAARVGAQLVYVSTDAVFDGGRGMYSEEDIPHPFSVYGQTKLQGEVVVQRESEALVLRTNFFGWSATRDRSILEFFVDKLSQGKRVTGYQDFVVTTTYVGDLVHTIWKLVGAGIQGTVHWGSADAQSKWEFGVLTAEAFNLDPSLIEPGQAPAGGAASRGARDLSLNSNKVEEILGRRALTQSAGIAAAKADFRSGGLLS